MTFTIRTLVRQIRIGICDDSEFAHDVVEGYTKEYCQKNGIDIEVIHYYSGEDLLNSANNKVHVKGCIGDDIQVEPRDLCILIANLIRNAVEAVEKMQNGEIWIEVSQGEHYLLFSIRNTFVGKLLADPEGVFITSKKDKGSHGYGLKNIISIVEKYHGKYVFKAENQIYSADVWIEC